MKSAYKRVASVIALCFYFLLGSPAQKAMAQSAYDDQYVSYEQFYNDLSPYGQWVDDPQYGYVFVPQVSADFRPYYTSGRWVMTDYGNTWVSDYAWGWACFHYGRWAYDPYYGWVWIPGSEWGPAWVSWRNGGGYYGWAPLGPWYAMSASYYSCPDDWWVFIPPVYLYTGGYYHYWYGPRHNTEIINNTTIINNTYVVNNNTYITGPRALEVEHLTSQPVKVYHIESSNEPRRGKVRGDIVKMYHPQTVRTTTYTGARPTPPNVIKAAQPVSTKPQPVSDNTPRFNTEVRRTSPVIAPAEPQYNQSAVPREQQQRTNVNDNNQRYQWDVNRSQPQTAQPPVREEQRAQPQQPVRPEPQQMNRPQQQPQPMNRPQQPMSRPAPAPRPQPSSQPSRAGGRR